MVLTTERLTILLKEALVKLGKVVDVWEASEYVLALLSLKRLSDQFEEEQKEYKTKKAKEERDNFSYFVPKEARWSKISESSGYKGETIDKALYELEKANSERLGGLFTPKKFTRPDLLTKEVLDEIISLYGSPDDSLTDSNLATPNVIGEAFENLIEEVAESSGRAGGDFYTTKEVVKTLVMILDPQESLRISDPVCGSGGFLVKVVEYLENKGQNRDNISLFGQEVKEGTWRIARLNLLLHGIDVTELKRGNTMTTPIVDGGSLMKFDIVMGNPIWNQKGDGWGYTLFKDGDPYSRAQYGLATKNQGDWMWVQHMLATLEDDGRMGIVLDNGALFRGGQEGKIRKKVIENDLIEGIIALPPNLFKGTGSPGCLIILNKKKPESLKEQIFFIHAENEHEEGKAQNYLRETHITKIVETYRNKTVIEKFSDLIEFKVIKENDFNLNVSRYIDILPEEEQIDLPCVWEQVESIQDHRTNLEQQLVETMKELGVKKN